jgi:hypothetical protein
MRDERIQRAGPFPRLKGSRIDHDKLREFIHRNYTCDEQGSWFFQNGPQRVYVELEAAPWVWRLEAGDAATPIRVRSHTGLEARPGAVWLDEHDRLFVECDLGLGIVHSQDMHLAADEVEAGRWEPQRLCFAEAPSRFGFVLRPQPQRQAGPD